MEFYVYQAALWCKDCGDELRHTLPKPESADERTFDSDDYPKGPYENEESDVPDHCDRCGRFLEQPLTRAGLEYVAEAIDEARAAGRVDSVAVQEWWPYYRDDLVELDAYNVCNRCEVLFAEVYDRLDGCVTCEQCSREIGAVEDEVVS